MSMHKNLFNEIACDISILDGESFQKNEIRERFQLIQEISKKALVISEKFWRKYLTVTLTMQKASFTFFITRTLFFWLNKNVIKLRYCFHHLK